MPDAGEPVFSADRCLPLVVLIVAGTAFVAFGGRHYLTFAALVTNRALMCGFVEHSPCLAGLAFIAAYAGLTALSIPGALILTIAGGFLFGTWLGGLSALIGATLGAAAVFLAARAGLAGLAQRAGPRFRRLEAGFRANALSYLLVLRLVPVVPFWLVNLVAGVTMMRPTSFLAGTFFGMIPATFVYASLGNGLGAAIDDGRSPDMHILYRPSVLLPLVALAALALLPPVWQRWRARHGEAAP
jgi:uncharacterized membrane protein YdjX (TVP38/TMEM64 family)